MAESHSCRRCGEEPDGAKAMFCEACWTALLQEGRTRDWRTFAARRDEPDYGAGRRWSLVGNRWVRD